MSTEHALRFLGDVAVRQGAADAECDREAIGVAVVRFALIDRRSLPAMSIDTLVQLACAYAKGHHHA